MSTTYDVVAVLAQAISQRIGEPRYNLWFQGKTKFLCNEDQLTIGVPNLFLQPLVENSFRHGFGDLGAGAIAISVRRDGDMLRCDVVDDGRGLRAGHKEGVGLASTRQRLAHLYGDRQAFSLRGAPGEGVHVSMAIPFHPYDRAAAD